MNGKNSEKFCILQKNMIVSCICLINFDHFIYLDQIICLMMSDMFIFMKVKYISTCKW